MRVSDWSSAVCSSDLIDWTANVIVSWLTVAELLSPVCSMSDTFCGVAPEPSSACVTFALLLAPLWLTSESPPESEPVWSTTAPLPVFDWFTVLVDWAQAGAAIEIGRASCGERVCQYG